MKRAVFLLSAALLLGCAHHHGPARFSIGHNWPWAHGADETPAPVEATPEPSTIPAASYPPFALYFAFNSASLRDSEADKLREALTYLHGTCRVTGFASPEGTDEYNLALGDARAHAVASYLSASPSLRIEVMSLGEEARVDNEDTALYWLDRRALVDCQ